MSRSVTRGRDAATGGGHLGASEGTFTGTASRTPTRNTHVRRYAGHVGTTRTLHTVGQPAVNGGRNLLGRMCGIAPLPALHITRNGAARCVIDEDGIMHNITVVHVPKAGGTAFVV